MKKKILSIVLALVLAVSVCLPASAATVVLSAQKLAVNGENINCEKYNIDGSNYFKLRDIAYVLNGTDSQFYVGWDATSQTISILTGEAYVSNGTELDLSGGDKSATAKPSTQTLKIDGKVTTGLSVYNIGGNNYFKLRDLGDALGFDVGYNDASRTATINSSSLTARWDGTLPLVGKWEDNLISIGVRASDLVLDYETNDYTKWLEDVTGLEINIIDFYGSKDDVLTQWSLMITAEEMLPDILIADGLEFLYQHVDNSAFVDMTEYFANDAYYTRDAFDLYTSDSAQAMGYYLNRITDTSTGKIFEFPSFDIDNKKFSMPACITTSCKKPEIAFRLLDLMSSPESYLRQSWGKKGTSWEYATEIAQNGNLGGEARIELLKDDTYYMTPNNETWHIVRSIISEKFWQWRK